MKTCKYFVVLALVGAMLVSCGKEEGEDTPPVLNYKVSVKDLVISGVSDQAKAEIESTIKRIEKDFQGNGKNIDEILTSAKSTFASQLNFIDESALKLKLADGIDVSAPVEMKAENVSKAGSIAFEAILINDGKTVDNKKFGIESSKKAETFLLTKDFGNQTLEPVQVMTKITEINQEITSFKTANSISSANVKITWKNLTVSQGSITEQWFLLQTYLQGSVEFLKMEKVVFADAFVVDSYEILQNLFDNGLRVSSWEVKSGILSLKKILKNKETDSNFVLAVGGYTDNLSWDFTDVPILTVEMINKLFTFVLGGQIAINSNSPAIEMSGNWFRDPNEPETSTLFKFEQVFKFRTSGVDFIAPWPTRKFIDANNDWTYPSIETAKQEGSQPSDIVKALYNFFSGRTWPN